MLAPIRKVDSRLDITSATQSQLYREVLEVHSPWQTDSVRLKMLFEIPKLEYSSISSFYK